jgi:hypothetical protein
MCLIKVFLKAFIAFGFLCVFLSCGSSDNTNSGNLRIVNLSIGSPPLSVLIDNNEYVADLTYLKNSGFSNGPSGEFNLKLSPSDSDNPIVTSVVNQNFESIEGTTTYISTGVYRGTPPSEIIKISTDRVPSDANEVQLKWVHSSPIYYNVDFDIYVLNENENCTNTSNHFPLVENLSYTDNSEEYRSLDSGVYNICIVPTGPARFDWMMINNHQFSSRAKHTIIIISDPETFVLGLYILDDVTGEEEIVFPR